MQTSRVIESIDGLKIELINIEANTQSTADSLEILNSKFDIDGFDEFLPDSEVSSENFTNIGQTGIGIIENSDLIQNFNSLRDAFLEKSDASCPVISLDVPEVPWLAGSTDIHCSIFEDNRFIFTALFLLSYLFIGYRIVMSA